MDITSRKPLFAGSGASRASSSSSKSQSTESDHTHSLPIMAYEKKILYELEHHNVLVIAGDTGSGKSTMVPQILVSGGWCGGSGSGGDGTGTGTGAGAGTSASTSPRGRGSGSRSGGGTAAAGTSTHHTHCIAISLPRRISVLNISSYVAAQRGNEPVGQGEVGHHVQFDKQMSLEKNKLIYFTGKWMRGCGTVLLLRPTVVWRRACM